MSKLPLERPSSAKKETQQEQKRSAFPVLNAGTLATPYQFCIKLEQERVRRHGGVPQE